VNLKRGVPQAIARKPSKFALDNKTVQGDQQKNTDEDENYEHEKPRSHGNTSAQIMPETVVVAIRRGC